MAKANAILIVRVLDMGYPNAKLPLIVLFPMSWKCSLQQVLQHIAVFKACGLWPSI